MTIFPFVPQNEEDTIMRKLFVAIGALLIAAAIVWKVGIAPTQEKRFPADWQYKVDAVGLTGYADEQGNFPEGTTLKDDPINISKRSIAIAQVNADGSVLLKDHYQVFDPATNALSWDYVVEATVDPVTGKHVNPEYANDYFFFPRDAQKTTYNVRNVSYQGLPLAFQQEETISGINTYHYSFKGDIDDTASYPDYALEPNQTILCLNFELHYWVEPTTGEVLKYREWCEEGDWIVNTETGEKIIALSRWGSDNSGDDLIRRTPEVRNLLNMTNLNRLYIPLALAVVGLIVMIFTLVPPLLRNRDAQISSIDKQEANPSIAEGKILNASTMDKSV
jgi:Porin PorA